jgi:hypothetical protein
MAVALQEAILHQHNINKQSARVGCVQHVCMLCAVCARHVQAAWLFLM